MTALTWALFGAPESVVFTSSFSSTASNATLLDPYIATACTHYNLVEKIHCKRACWGFKIANWRMRMSHRESLLQEKRFGRNKANLLIVYFCIIKQQFYINIYMIQQTPMLGCNSAQHCTCQTHLDWLLLCGNLMRKLAQTCSWSRCATMRTTSRQQAQLAISCTHTSFFASFGWGWWLDIYIPFRGIFEMLPSLLKSSL